MRILLAEDERTLATWLARALEQSGVLADWVDNGRDVLPSLAARRYDALVLDLGLPGMDGREVLAALRASGEALPVLVLTARELAGLFDGRIDVASTVGVGSRFTLTIPFTVEVAKAA